VTPPWRRRTGGPALGWVFLQAALFHSAFSVVRPMVSYRALELGAGGTEIGILAASFAVLPLLLAFAVGRQADTLGPHRVVTAGAIVLLLGCLAALLAPGFVVLLLGAAALGLGHLLTMAGQQTTVARSAVGLDRDRGFGSLTAAASVGQMLGPPLALSVAGWAAATRGWSESTVGLGIAAVLVVVAIATLTRPRPAPAKEEGSSEPTTSRRAFWELIRTRGMWQAMATSGAVLAALDLLLAFLPLWAQERGVSVATVGWLLAVRALVSLVSRVAVVRLIAAITRRWTMVGSLFMGVAGLALMPFVDVPGAVVAMCLLGVGLGLTQPLTLSWVSSLSAPNVRGAAIGLRLTANRLAQTVLPPVIGFAVADDGSTGVFLGCAVVLAAASGTVLRRRMHEPPPGA
jgi:predicted MFS family arabinose efflux permease